MAELGNRGTHITESKGHLVNSFLFSDCCYVPRSIFTTLPPLGITTDKRKVSIYQQNTALMPQEAKQEASGFCLGLYLIHLHI